MKLFSIAIAGLLAAACPAAAQDLDAAVLAEMNFVRSHPAEYAQELRRDEFSDDPQAQDEAIEFLERQAPLAPLRADPRLSASAYAHVAAQGPRGDLGHGSASGGLSQRLQRQGLWAGLAAEDISYGYADPRDVVRQLVIDSGVAGRGHRKNIFGAAFQAAGVSCGRHSIYGAMCVIDFAGAIMER